METQQASLQMKLIIFPAAGHGALLCRDAGFQSCHTLTIAPQLEEDLKSESLTRIEKARIAGRMTGIHLNSCSA